MPPADKGFGVGHTRATQTKGIWLWAAPQETQAPGGGPLSVIYVDTEGFESTGKSDAYDDRIFALSALLSSVLMCGPQPCSRGLASAALVAKPVCHHINRKQARHCQQGLQVTVVHQQREYICCVHGYVLTATHIIAYIHHPSTFNASYVHVAED